MWNFYKRQIYSHEKQICSYLWSGVEERIDFKEHKGTFGDDGNILKLSCGYDGIVVQIY